MMQVFLDEDKMEISVERIKVHVREENLEFETIKGAFSAINGGYKTENTGTLQSIKSELNNKMKIVEQIHDNNVFVLTTRIQKHRKFVKEESKMLKESEDVKVV